MNIETVNDLIKSLESAGELSIKEQKFLKLAKAYQQLVADRESYKSTLDRALLAERALGHTKTLLSTEKQRANEYCGQINIKNDLLDIMRSGIKTYQLRAEEIHVEAEALRAQVEQLTAENTYLLNGAARELNTSWMFHKTMLGAQAALACLSLGRESAARDWLEGTTDEAGAEIPDDITVAGLQAWFDSQMVSNDGKSGFLTRAEAEEAIRKACPATDRIVAGIKADGVEEWVSSRGGRWNSTTEEALKYATQLRKGASE